jgi:uncharacterized protein YndB with AHSA1/START domain
MLKIIATSLAIIVVLVVVVAAYAATQPDHFTVQRSASIKAPAEKIFSLISDLHAFNSWNPFDKQDPNIKGSYSGPAAGNGARYAFESGKAGTGSLEIVDTAAPSRVTMRLLMSRPLAADNRVDFTIQPEGNATRVTWAMNGDVPFIGKVLHLVFNMDKMVGGQFEAGLAELKSLAEKSASPTS